MGKITPRLRTGRVGILVKTEAKPTLTGRYISAFTNDEGANSGEQIDSFITVDGQVMFNIPAVNLGGLKEVEPTITIGATNLLNEEPPFADTTNAFPFATRVHDPRGRSLFAYGSEVLTRNESIRH